MIKQYLLALIFMLPLSFTGCSSDKKNIIQDEINNTQEQNNNQNLVQNIAPQPLLTYRADESIEELQTGYGRFGSHGVKTKSIPNTRYDYNEAYKALNLQTTLYYPDDITTPLPTLFFYNGYSTKASEHSPDNFKGLLYFVASKGYNIVFITYPKVELRNLPVVTRDALSAFSEHIDKTKVGFSGHSLGAGVTFWMVNELSELGSDARILFPLASGYTVFNSFPIFEEKTIALPANTKMIQQVYAKDFTTDIRIGIDLYLNNSIQTEDKEYMFLYGDETHITDHGAMKSRDGYDYDAMMQRSIFRPLDALMDEAFNGNTQARTTLKNALQEDAYFNPYIGKTPQIDIKPYVLSEGNYSYNCSEGGHVPSKRKEYCKALEL